MWQRSLSSNLIASIKDLVRPSNFYISLSSLIKTFQCDIAFAWSQSSFIEYLPDIGGNLPLRINPDKSKNSHGNHFVTFLKDNRTIILNGRVTPELNNFTFVSPRGSSVPDYIFCPLVFWFVTWLMTLQFHHLRVYPIIPF